MENRAEISELGKVFDVNPTRTIKRGEVTPFIPMEALPEHSREVSHVYYREYSGSGTRFKNGDTLIARITPCLENGKTVYISCLAENVIAHGSTEYIVLSGKQDVSEGLYGYYLARSPDFRAYAIAHMEGTSGRQRVPASAVENYRITHLPLPEQRAIAEVLGSLDDKIELNRRMNQTLEALSQAIFKSWFIDFDPVQAKMKGHPPAAMDAEMASLFPNAMDGDVPSGWRRGSIFEISDLVGGGTPSTSEPEYWNGDISWVSAKDVSNVKGIFLLQTEKTITESGVKNSSTKILPMNTTIVTARGTVGACCILGKEMAMNQTNYGLVSKDEVCPYFVFFSLSNIVRQLKQQSYGTIFDTITTKTFENIQITLPPSHTILKFESFISPVIELILENQLQSATLSELRDTLLPVLLNGEVKVDILDNQKGL